MHNGGYVKAYPKYFDPAWHANGKTSNLTRAMDLARYSVDLVLTFTFHHTDQSKTF